MTETEDNPDGWTGTKQRGGAVYVIALNGGITIYLTAPLKMWVNINITSFEGNYPSFICPGPNKGLSGHSMRKSRG